MSIVISQENFTDEVLNSDVPVLVDFWAEWCGPCKMLAPVLEELDQEIIGSAKIVKINVDEEMELTQQYGVMSIPTLIVFKGGQIVNKTVGYKTKDDLKKLLEI